MKYLILLGVISAVLWWLKTQRNSNNSAQDASPQPQNMVRCSYCDLHLPQGDALQGSQGFYCSSAHRSAKEG